MEPVARTEHELDGFKNTLGLYREQLGTPQELTDYSGEIIWSATYDAYGKITEQTSGGGEQIDQPLRFQGQYFDAESGLHYKRHRYYDPGFGRYLTPDPVKLAGGLNSYQYTPNPTGWVDPLGLSGNCPGGNKPGCGAPDDTTSVRGDEVEPALPVVISGVDPNSLKRTHAIEGKTSTKKVEGIAGKMQKSGYDDNWLIEVLEYYGNRYLVDGHHRASAARRTNPKLNMELIKDIFSHESIFNSVDEIKEFAENVGRERLVRPRG